MFDTASAILRPTSIYEALFLGILVIWIIIIRWVMVAAFQRGSFVFTLLSFWLASILPMTLVTTIIEGRSLQSVFDANLASWQFIYGDSICLPAGALLFCAVWKWRTIDKWARGELWALISLLIGVASGIAFHVQQASVYSPLLLHSPSKLVHDLVAYPLLVSGMLYGGWPALTSSFRHHDRTGIVLSVLGVVVGVGGWVVLGVIHHEFSGSLDPAHLHVPWRWQPPIGVIHS